MCIWCKKIIFQPQYCQSDYLGSPFAPRCNKYVLLTGPELRLLRILFICSSDKESCNFQQLFDENFIEFKPEIVPLNKPWKLSEFEEHKIPPHSSQSLLHYTNSSCSLKVKVMKVMDLVLTLTGMSSKGGEVREAAKKSMRLSPVKAKFELRPSYLPILFIWFIS